MPKTESKQPGAAAGMGQFSTDLLDQVRSRFHHMKSDPVMGPRIYFESAGGSLSLRSAVERSAEIAARPDNAGRDNASSRDLESIMARGREDAELFLGARSGRIISGESTTANVFRIVEAMLKDRKGGNVVTTSLEHPCTFGATKFYARRSGLEWRVAPIAPRTGELTPESISDRVDEDTAAVVFIHASNVIGTRVDAGEVVDQVRRRNQQALILVDGAQRAPHGPIDVEQLGADAYCFAPYKTFSVLGTCFAWLSDRMVQLDHPRLDGTPVTTWELGTRDPSGFAAWSEVVAYLLWLGSVVDPNVTDRRARIVSAMTSIEQHESALTAHMIDGLSSIPGIRLFGVPDASERREAVFAVTMDGMTAGELVIAMGARGISVHDRKHDAYSGHILEAIGAPDCVRISMAHYNTTDEIDALLAALDELGAC
jgi:selenocysteine lyase/cysteine desulfurase